MSNSSPLRSRLIKAILSSLEVNNAGIGGSIIDGDAFKVAAGASGGLVVFVPSEALHSSWTEEFRKVWSSELQNFSSIEGLLQILTQFEAAIKRDYLSEDFETTDELLRCDSSKGSAAAAGELNHLSKPVPQLPWIPKTTAAVSLRLLELDASIFYTPNQKAESLIEKKVEPLPTLYAHCKDTPKTESIGFDRHGYIK